MTASYRAIVDRIAGQIAAGTLRAGDRLPPQREFADQQRIAASTASRVYSELARRGLVTGEVGRGTYVRAASSPAFSLGESPAERINLESNLPVLPGQLELLASSLAPLVKRRSVMETALLAGTVSGSAGSRQTVATFLSRRGWTVDPRGVCFTGNGKQALAAVMAALVPAGERLGVEAVSYSTVKVLASRFGIELVPLAMDESGIRPEALAAVQRKTPMRAIYCQPALHNPLGITMPAKRRAEIAAVLTRLDLLAIEDLVYGFLADPADLPLAAVAPDHTVVIDSLSKRVAPGISIGFIVSPAVMAASLASAVRAGAWGPSGLSMELCTRWMADGTVAAISADKRRDAVARQRLLRKIFTGLTLQSNPRAYHAWLVLPERWRAETFVAAAAERGIGITPAAAFTTSPGHAPNAVRIALASPTMDVLEAALRSLATLARERPREWETE